jgi:hypothetical protein
MDAEEKRILIEELKEKFSARPEIVTKLPDAKDVGDFKNVLIEEGGVYKEYRLINGEWKLKITYT